MEIIGVTGLSGSGKSTYCHKLSESGNFALIEVDKIVYATLESKEFVEKAVKLLETDAFIIGGKTDRRIIGEIVFAASKETIDKYNFLIWGFVEPQIDELIRKAKGQGKDVIIEYLFLTITKFFEMCTKKVLVVRDDLERIKAAARRDGVGVDYISARDNAFKFVFDEKDFDEVVNIEHKAKALFAGSFDPFTLGHLDVVRQASELFDEVVVGIAINCRKPTREFDRDEMLDAIKTSIKEAGIGNCTYISYDGRTGDEAKKMGVCVLVRGKRGDGDEEYENALADYNKDNFGLDTMFFCPANDEVIKISSSKVKSDKEVAKTSLPRAVFNVLYGVR